jgi:hypothetical protein
MLRWSQTLQYEIASRAFELQNQIVRGVEFHWRASKDFPVIRTSSRGALKGKVGPETFVQAHEMTRARSSRPM